MRSLLHTDEIRIDSWLSEAEERSLANDVLDGLTRPFKELPPKHFYDARGSELFEQICELPEYYPTRSEREILERHADEIVETTGAGELVELGSGSAEKARILLGAMAWLALTGYLLYYAGGESLRWYAAQSHLWVGIAACAIVSSRAERLK